MASSLLGTVVLIVIIAVGAYVTYITLNQSGALVDLEVSLRESIQTIVEESSEFVCSLDIV